MTEERKEGRKKGEYGERKRADARGAVGAAGSVHWRGTLRATGRPHALHRTRTPPTAYSPSGRGRPLVHLFSCSFVIP